MGEEHDNEAIQNMTYINKQAELMKSFGTKKSKRKMQSMLTNKVEDGEVTGSKTMGVRDIRLAEKAMALDGE